MLRKDRCWHIVSTFSADCHDLAVSVSAMTVQSLVTGDSCGFFRSSHGRSERDFVRQSGGSMTMGRSVNGKLADRLCLHECMLSRTDIADICDAGICFRIFRKGMPQMSRCTLWKDSWCFHEMDWSGKGPAAAWPVRIESDMSHGISAGC